MSRARAVRVRAGTPCATGCEQAHDAGSQDTARTLTVVFLRSCPRLRCARATCPREKQVSLRCASRHSPRAPHSHCAVLPAARASSIHVCMLPLCTMCCCAVRHRGLRALAVRMCSAGRWRGVTGRGYAIFVTTRPGVCPLAQASATARLYWPLTRHTGTACQRDAPSSRTCTHLPHLHAIALNTLL